MQLKSHCKPQSNGALSVATPAPKVPRAVVALSSGHSVYESGVAAHGRIEYNEALRIVNAAAAKLTQRGFAVHVTNRRDAGGDTPTHAARAINATGADVAVEVHLNAFNGTAHGTESFYWHASSRGKKLSQLLCKHITTAIGTANRGAKPYSGGERGVVIVRDTKMPTALLEVLFLDNKTEAAKLDNTASIATSIVDAFEEYLAST